MNQFLRRSGVVCQIARHALEPPANAAIDTAGLAPSGVHALEAVRLEAPELCGCEIRDEDTPCIALAVPPSGRMLRPGSALKGHAPAYH